MEQDKAASITVASAPVPSGAAPPGFKLIKIRRDGKIITVKRPITTTTAAAPAATATTAGPATITIKSKTVVETSADAAKPTSALAAPSENEKLATASASTALPNPNPIPTLAKIDALANSAEPFSSPTAQTAPPVKASTTVAAVPAKLTTAPAATTAVQAGGLSTATSSTTSMVRPVADSAKAKPVPTNITPPATGAFVSVAKPSTFAPTTATSATAARPPISATTGATAKATVPAPTQPPPANADAATKLKWYEHLKKVDISKFATGIENTAKSVEVIGNAATRIGAVLTGEKAVLEAAKATAAKGTAKPATTAPASKAAATPAVAVAPVGLVTTSREISSNSTAADSGAAQSHPTTVLITAPAQPNAAQPQPGMVILQNTATDAPVSTSCSVSNVKVATPSTTQRSIARPAAAGPAREVTKPVTPRVVLRDPAAAIELSATSGLVRAATPPSGYNAARAGAMSNHNMSRDASNYHDNYNEYSVYGSDKNYPDRSYNNETNYYDNDNGSGVHDRDAALVIAEAAAGGTSMELYGDFLEGDEIVGDDDGGELDTSHNLSTGGELNKAQVPSTVAADLVTYPSHEVINQENDEEIEEYNPETDEIYDDGNDVGAALGEHNAGSEPAEEEEDGVEIFEYNPETDEPWEGEDRVEHEAIAQREDEAGSEDEVENEDEATHEGENDSHALEEETATSSEEEYDGNEHDGMEGGDDDEQYDNDFERTLGEEG